jgi:hypothetical protein
VADQLGNQYLIAVQVKQLEQLQALGNEIDRIQRLSANEAKFRVTVDPSALGRVGDLVTAKIEEALGGRGKGGNAPPPHLGDDSTPNTSGFTGADAASIRELRSLVAEIKTATAGLTTASTALSDAIQLLGRPRTNTPSVEGDAHTHTAGPTQGETTIKTDLDLDMTKLNQQFEALGEKIAEKMTTELRNLPNMMDFSAFFEKAQKHAEAIAAGLDKSFGNDQIGYQEAFKIYNSPSATAKQRELAERRLWEQQDKVVEVLKKQARSEEENAKRRERATKLMEESAKRSLATDPRYKDIEGKHQIAPKIAQSTAIRTQREADEALLTKLNTLETNIERRAERIKDIQNRLTQKEPEILTTGSKQAIAKSKAAARDFHIQRVADQENLPLEQATVADERKEHLELIRKIHEAVNPGKAFKGKFGLVGKRDIGDKSPPTPRQKLVDQFRQIQETRREAETVLNQEIGRLTASDIDDLLQKEINRRMSLVHQGKIDLDALGEFEAAMVRRASRKMRELSGVLKKIAKGENKNKIHIELDEYRKNPVLKKLLEGVNSAETAKEAREEVERYRPVLRDQRQIFDIIEPPKNVRAPKLNPLQISNYGIDLEERKKERDRFRAETGRNLPKSPEEKETEQYYTYMIANAPRGGGFTRFGTAEKQVILDAQRELEGLKRAFATRGDSVNEQKVEKRIASLSEMYQLGGQYHPTHFAGFTELHKAVNPADFAKSSLPPEAFARLEHLARIGGIMSAGGHTDPAAVSLLGGLHGMFGGGGGSGTGSGITITADHIEKLGSAIEKLGNLNLVKAAEGLNAFAKEIAKVQSKFAGLDPLTRKAMGISLRNDFEVQQHERRVNILETRGHESRTTTEENEKNRQATVEKRAKSAIDVERERLPGRQISNLNEQLRLERERIRFENSKLRLSAAADDTPAAIKRALLQRGLPSGVNNSPDDVIRGVRRYLGRVRAGREAASGLELLIKENQSKGLPTGSLETGLLRTLDKTEVNQLQLLNYAEQAHKAFPRQFADVGADAAQLRQAKEKRLQEQLDYETSRKKIADEFGALEAKKAELEQELFPHGLGPAPLATAGRTTFDALGKPVFVPGEHYDKTAAAYQEKHQEYETVNALLSVRDPKKEADAEEAHVKRMRDLRAGEDAMANSIAHRAKAGVEGLDALKKEGNFLEFVGQKLKSIATYAGLGYALYGIFGTLSNAFRESQNLESSLANIQGVLSSRSISDRLEIKSGIIQAARDYGVELSKVAEITKTFAQTGIGAKQSVEQTRAALAAVQGAGLEPKQATELLIAADNISKGLVKGEDIIDRISLVEAKYAVTAQDLSVSLQRVGALATQLQPGRLGGVDAFDTVIGATTKIVEATRVTGNQAATSLRFMFARLASPEIQKTLQGKFGINLATSDNGHELRPLQDIIGSIAQKYQELKNPNQAGGPRTIEAAALLNTFAGARQVNAAAALLDNWTEVLKISTESSRAFGDTQRRVAIQMDTWSSRMQQFHNSLVAFIDALLHNTGIFAAGKGFLKSASETLTAAAKHPAETLAAVTLGGTAVAGLVGIPAYRTRIGRRVDDLVRYTGKPPEALTTEELGGTVARIFSQTTPKLAAGGLAREVTGAARVFGTLSKFALGVFEWVGILGGILSILSLALQWWRGKKAEIDKVHAQYGFDRPDVAELQKSSAFVEFREHAGKLNASPEDVRDAVIVANREAQRRVATAVGIPREKLFTEDDKARRYNPRVDELFKTELVKQLAIKFPELSKIPTEADRANEALALLKGTMIQLTGAAGQLESQLDEHLKGENERTAANFAAAETDKTIYRQKDLPVQSPQTKQFDNVLSRNAGSSATAGQGVVPLKYGLDNLGDLTRGIGLAYTKAFADAQRSRQSSALEVQRDILTIFNGIAPKLGDTFATARIQFADGQRTLLEQLMQLAGSSKTLGEAFDELAKNTFNIVPEPVTGTPDELAAIRAHNATATAGREQLIQAELTRKTNLIDNKGLRSELQRALGVDVSGTGGNAGANFINSIQRDADERIRKEIAKYKAEGRGKDAQDIQNSLTAGQNSGNRPQGKAAIPEKGTGQFRDRILEVLLQYGQRREENLARRDRLGGIAGFDFIDANRQNARALAEGIEGAVSQVKGDLVRAYDALFSANLSRGVGSTKLFTASQLEENGGLIVANKAVLDEATRSEAGGGEEENKRLEQRLKSAQRAVDAVSKNQALFNNLPPELQGKIVEATVGAQKGEKPQQTYQRLLATLDKIRTYARDTFAAAEAEYYARERTMDVLKQSVEIDRQRLDAAHQLNALYREEAGRRFAITQPGGGEFRTQYAAIGQDSAERRESINQEASGKLADLNLRKFYGITVGKQYDYERDKIERERLAEAALEGDREYYAKVSMVERERTVLLEEQARSARQLIQQSVSGLRTALGEGLKGFSGKPAEWLDRIFKPFFAALQQRIGDRFLDSLLGPNGLFGAQLEKLAGSDALLDQETLARKEYLRQLELMFLEEDRLRSENIALRKEAADLPVGPNTTSPQAGPLSNIEPAHVAEIKKASSAIHRASDALQANKSTVDTSPLLQPSAAAPGTFGAGFPTLPKNPLLPDSNVNLFHGTPAAPQAPKPISPALNPNGNPFVPTVKSTGPLPAVGPLPITTAPEPPKGPTPPKTPKPPKPPESLSEIAARTREETLTALAAKHREEASKIGLPIDAVPKVNPLSLTDKNPFQRPFIRNDDGTLGPADIQKYLMMPFADSVRKVVGDGKGYGTLSRDSKDWGLYDVRTDRVSFDPGLFLRTAPTQATFAPGGKSRETADIVFAHEMGHRYEEAHKAFFNKWAAAHPSANNRDPYSRTDMSEAFAQAFSSATEFLRRTDNKSGAELRAMMSGELADRDKDVSGTSALVTQLLKDKVYAQHPLKQLDAVHHFTKTDPTKPKPLDGRGLLDAAVAQADAVARKRILPPEDRTIGPVKTGNLPTGNIPLPRGHAEELNPVVQSVPHALGEFSGMSATFKAGQTTAALVDRGDYFNAAFLAGGVALSALPAERVFGLAGVNQLVGEPALANGFKRLYRGETEPLITSGKGLPSWMRGDPRVQATNNAIGRWFSASRDEAYHYARHFGDDPNWITYVDVPAGDFEKYRVSNLGPEVKQHSAIAMRQHEFFVPPEVAAGRKPVFTGGRPTPRTGGLQTLADSAASRIRYRPAGDEYELADVRAQAASDASAAAFSAMQAEEAAGRPQTWVDEHGKLQRSPLAQKFVDLNALAIQAFHDRTQIAENSLLRQAGFPINLTGRERADAVFFARTGKTIEENKLASVNYLKERLGDSTLGDNLRNQFSDQLKRLQEELFPDRHLEKLNPALDSVFNRAVVRPQFSLTSPTTSTTNAGVVNFSLGGRKAVVPVSAKTEVAESLDQRLARLKERMAAGEQPKIDPNMTKRERSIDYIYSTRLQVDQYGEKLARQMMQEGLHPDVVRGMAEGDVHLMDTHLYREGDHAEFKLTDSQYQLAGLMQQTRARARGLGSDIYDSMLGKIRTAASEAIPHLPTPTQNDILAGRFEREEIIRNAGAKLNPGLLGDKFEKSRYKRLSSEEYIDLLAAGDDRQIAAHYLRELDDPHKALEALRTDTRVLQPPPDSYRDRTNPVLTPTTEAMHRAVGRLQAIAGMKGPAEIDFGLRAQHLAQEGFTTMQDELKGFAPFDLSLGRNGTSLQHPFVKSEEIDPLAGLDLSLPGPLLTPSAPFAAPSSLTLSGGHSVLALGGLDNLGLTDFRVPESLGGPPLPTDPNTIGGISVAAPQAATIKMTQQENQIYAEYLAKENAKNVLRAQQIQQLKVSGAQLAGSFISSKLNDGKGLFGVKMGVNHGYNYAQEGSAVGSTAGAYVGNMLLPGLGGVVGGFLGGLAGGALGGLFKKKKPETPIEMAPLEAIERNTRETVSVITNQSKLLQLDNRLLNVPATFSVPRYAIEGGGSTAGGSTEAGFGQIHIHVNGAQNPEATGNAVVGALRKQLGQGGSFISPRSPRQG